jgi:hypothetical protein
MNWRQAPRIAGPLPFTGQSSTAPTAPAASSGLYRISNVKHKNYQLF